MLAVNTTNFNICYNNESESQENRTQIFTYLIALIPFTIGVGVLAYKLATRKITQPANTEIRAMDNSNSFSTDKKAYKALKTVLEQESPNLYLTDEIGEHEEKIQGILGGGQFKTAYKLSGDRALLLPNMDKIENDLFFFYPPDWERMVKEEVKMSQFLNEIKLLSPHSRLVGVSISENSDKKIPAYISISFDAMKKAKGCYIIDGKDGNNMKISSTWVKGKKFLFKTEGSRLIEENWDTVTKKLIKDVLNLCRHDISVDSDCASIAIEKKTISKDRSISKYNIRYFGFDFSKKCTSLSEPNVLANSPITENKIGFIVGIIMLRVLKYEFCNIASEQEKGIKKFQKKIIKRCVKQALSKQLK